MNIICKQIIPHLCCNCQTLTSDDENYSLQGPFQVIWHKAESLLLPGTSGNLQLHILAEGSTPKTPFPRWARDRHLTQCVTGPHKVAAMAPKSIKRFKQDAWMWRTTDKREKCVADSAWKLFRHVKKFDTPLAAVLVLTCSCSMHQKWWQPPENFLRRETLWTISEHLSWSVVIKQKQNCLVAR